MLAAVNFLPDRADRERISADKKLGEMFNRADHSALAARKTAFAQSEHAFVRLDLHEQLIANFYPGCIRANEADFQVPVLRRRFEQLLFAASSAGIARTEKEQETLAKTMMCVGGCSRRLPHGKAANAMGIEAFIFGEQTGGVTPASAIDGIDSPTFLSVDPSGPILNATGEIFERNEGDVTT